MTVIDSNLDAFDQELHAAAMKIADKHGGFLLMANTDDQHITLSRALLQLAAYRDMLPSELVCYPSIQLNDGSYFDYTQPENSPMPPRTIAVALAKVARFGGHTKSEDIIYSVAQHNVHACEQAPPEFKFEALLHDAPEFAYGDMLTPLKQLCPDYKKFLHRGEAAFAERFHLPLKMSSEVKLIDMRLAATEKRDLMPPDPPGEEWEFLKKFPPFDFTITEWTIPEARERWLALFNELWPSHQAEHENRLLNALKNTPPKE